MTARTTHARLPIGAPARLMEHIRAELAAQDLHAEESEAGLIWDSGIGIVRLVKARGAVDIRIDSDSLSNLHMLREGVRDRIERHAAEAARSLEWRGSPANGPYPPNFRVTRVVSSRRIAPRFQRLELEAQDLGDFARSGLHVRLVIPPAGREPVWPRLNEKGRTIWPTGADAPHMPAYTIRDIDPDAGRLWIDVLVHGRGPTCKWAQSVAPGALVGLTGPGGGWYPLADRVLLGGDETALPAILRTLENAPDDMRGDVLIETESDADRMPLRHPPGLRVRWLIRQGGDPDLNTALESMALPAGEGALVWFAAEKQQAARAREYLRNAPGLTRKHIRVAAYWRDER